MTVRSHFRAQAAACARLGSPFTAGLLELVAERLEEAGALGRAVLSWQGDPKAGALALRVAAGLHALVLSGAAPSLRPSIRAAPGPTTAMRSGRR